MENLHPAAVWRHFAALCATPRPSGHTEAARDYVVATARRAGCTVETDGAGNVLARLAASPSGAARAAMALQAHIDMVPQARPGVTHDFRRDPICPHESDGWVMADGTTLGADNGIGVAAMLALMEESALPHGPLEFLFTTDEETGMSGATAMAEGWLHSHRLINLDAETDGTLMAGCAGAVDVEATFKYRMDTAVPDGDIALRLTLGGLRGGHSGMDIHRSRANAAKLMVRFLKHAVINYEVTVAELRAGGTRNAIPRDATAVVTVPANLESDLRDEVAAYEEMYRHEWHGVEADITFRADRTQMPAALIPEDIRDTLINCIEAVHDGVWRMSTAWPGVVSASSNLAVIEAAEGEAHVVSLVRAMAEEAKRALASQVQSAFSLGGARVDFGAAYPGWELSPSSPLLAAAQRAYRAATGTAARVNAVHCGLECGVLASRCPTTDIISVGPTILDPHSPSERVEVASVERFYRFLKELVATA